MFYHPFTTFLTKTRINSIETFTRQTHTADSKNTHVDSPTKTHSQFHTIGESARSRTPPLTVVARVRERTFDACRKVQLGGRRPEESRVSSSECSCRKPQIFHYFHLTMSETKVEQVMGAPVVVSEAHIDPMRRCYENMIVVDVGANLTNKKFTRDLDSVVQRAKDAGGWPNLGFVCDMLCVLVAFTSWIVCSLHVILC